ncbi:hypothetical protein G7054_g7797 [Neopestalotiopsis clavispora]|nr:hypothetical protein G7054_g7797 [Neopestalotiopsis clavispora]
MLCQICENGVRTVAGRMNEVDITTLSSWDRELRIRAVKLHHDVNDFHNSIVAGCLFCRHMWAICLQRRPQIKGDDGRINFRLLKDEMSKNGKLSLTKLQLLVRPKYITATVLDNSTTGVNTKYLMSGVGLHELKDHGQSPPSKSPTSTKSSNALWLKWYNTCKNDHPGCQPSTVQPPFRPTRLIQVHGRDFDIWNLVDETKSITEPYATLSHCWGNSQHETLTRENISRYKEKNSITGLPKTFRDAIEVAKSLGIYYIWVDSLCIIQQDQQDWNEQAILMRKVYTHADCNIAASWARGSDEGCFITSDAALKHPTLVDLGFQFKSCSVYQFSPMRSTNRVSPDLCFIDNDLTRAPLNSRAWVIQERYMAPRQLSFTASQVYWECSTLVANEQCPTGFADEYWDLVESLWKRKLLPTSKADLQHVWRYLVEHYSSCGLTKKTDKAIALKGLAEYLEMTQSDTGNTYLHGLWRHDLYRQLCWEPSFRLKQIPKQIDISIAPTWSWLSLDGRVHQDEAFDGRLGDSVMSWIQVLEDAHSSEPRDGLLSLRGIAVFGTLEDRRSEKSRYENHVVSLSAPLKSRSGGSLDSFDAHIKWSVSQWPPEFPQPENLCFFLVRFDPLHELADGLVLQKIPGLQNRDEYVRLGSFRHKCRDGVQSTHRSGLMEHIAVLQGLPIRTKPWPTAFPGSNQLEQMLAQHAKENPWEMDLDRDGMQDLVRTVHIR